MLIDVRNDDGFQRYLDREEQRLHGEMMPTLTAGIRLQLNIGSWRALAYVEERGGACLLKTYRRIYTDGYIAVADALGEGKAANPGAGGVRNFLRLQLDDLTARASRAIRHISTTLINGINELIWQGVRDGRSTDAIVREISRQAPEISKPHAATIARTETHNSALAAIDATLRYKQIRVRTKMWWSVADTRVRPSHREAHGQTVPYDQPFTVGEALMMRPGDASLGARADEIVNCRCSVLFNTR